MTTRATLEALGDRALLLRFGETLDPAIVARVQAAARRARATAPAAVQDIVPAYASLAVHLAADAFDEATLAGIEAWLLSCAGDDFVSPAPARTVEIPVRYGGEHGPDLAFVARHAGLAVEDVIARHARAEYTVAMLGFAPGFPYLAGLDPALATPRHPQPRTRVAAGSVGIGGAQAVVYPRESPGGWQIIGRTPLVLFDPARAEPSLLQPGDRVRFVPHA